MKKFFSILYLSYIGGLSLHNAKQILNIMTNDLLVTDPITCVENVLFDGTQKVKNTNGS